MPIPSESGSSLRPWNSDNDHRSRLRQGIRRLEPKKTKPLLIKLVVKQALIAESNDFFLQ
jgi:hypothetical protein